MKPDITMKDIVNILIYALFTKMFASSLWFAVCYTIKNLHFINLIMIVTFMYGLYCAIKDIVNLLIRIARR